MKRALPPYVYAQTVRGRVYHYFRKDGRTVRVHPDKPGFYRLYEDLKADKTIITTERNFAALIDHYYRSKKFAKLAPRTQRDYRKHLDKIKARMGKNNPATVQKHHVIRWRDELEGRAASYFVQVLRIIMEIGLGTVQRPDDWTRLNWEDFDGTSIRMTQSKTGKPLVLPCSTALLAVLQSRPKVMRINGATPIISAKGKRLSYRRMAEIMLAERRRLGTEAHDLHALRYTGVMELARSGCDDAEIMSYSGHDTREMVEKYAGAARQEMRAKSAKKKRDGG